MNIQPQNLTIADYCQGMERGEITVNRDYQRSDLVWPQIARSYLIESIILGFPIPKLSLHQLTDLRSKKTFKEIVDGQQRSMAIRDFFTNKLRLAPSLETSGLGGKTYAEIDEAHQRAFLDYSLSYDLFVAATREEVREVFRRMNSYTVPLNPEEQRHAQYQGKFKWFVNRVTKRFDESFLQMGIFTVKQLVRMADTKLISEVSHSFLLGIQTTNKTLLDRIYSGRDASFDEEHDLEERITGALDHIRDWTDLHGGPLMKPYIVYSLILASSHILRAAPTLEGVFPSPALRAIEPATALTNLALLGEALEADKPRGQLKDFVTACRSRTNVRDQRETRFVWLCKALSLPSIA